MTKKAKPGSRGYSATAKIALQEAAARVQEIHHAIAGTTFDVLTKIPSISTTATIVKQAHDAITNSVYAAIHHGGGRLLDAADAIEQQFPDATSSDNVPTRLASKLRSAINGAFGDHLAESGSVLAISMGLYRQGREVPLTTDALHALLAADATNAANPNRVCVFIHGLGCSEHCWEADATANPPQIDMPHRLAVDAHWTTLTLRYNTGLPIEDNGLQLAALLDQLVAAWPAPLAELMIIGHSMGGLLARSAFAQGVSTGQEWPAKTRKIICIGTPHLGSPVERLGQLTTSALRLSPYTEPLARVAARRSQGIQDLRHGPGTHDAETIDYPPVAWRFIGGSLSDDPESALSRIVGDGLVTPDSATAHAAEGNVQSIRFGGISHMGLLNHARVYAQVLDWVRE